MAVLYWLHKGKFWKNAKRRVANPRTNALGMYLPHGILYGRETASEVMVVAFQDASLEGDHDESLLCLEWTVIENPWTVLRLLNQAIVELSAETALLSQALAVTLLLLMEDFRQRSDNPKKLVCCQMLQ